MRPMLIILFLPGLLTIANSAPVDLAANGNRIESRFLNGASDKRDSSGDTVLNEVNRYTDDVITERDEDNKPIVNNVNFYTDDVITKRDEDSRPIGNNVNRYTDDVITKRDEDSSAASQ